MGERVVPANGIEIWTEDFGSTSDPTVLLIMGAMAQGILWTEEFCEDLADAGRHVIRYDARDTGESTCIDFAARPYTHEDMAADAIGVLDAYDVPAAHVVGLSMGGYVAQHVAINYPDRVLSLTSIMSTTGQAGLPAADQDLVDSAGLMLSPFDRDEERIDRTVASRQLWCGPFLPFDEQGVRDREKRVINRARNLGAAINHAFIPPVDRTEALGRVTAPTLVIHGTADRAVPLVHGEATAQAIPGARLLPIEGMGHYAGPPVPAEVLGGIVAHTS